MSTEQIWLIVGFIGQTVFASRFLIQWIVSERASKISFQIFLVDKLGRKYDFTELRDT